jgi:hypothetical protein
MKNMEKVKIHFSKYVASDRTDIAGLLLNAVSSLVESEEDFLEAIRQVVRYYEERTGYYSVLAVSKDDIRYKGFNPDRLGPEEMRRFEDEFANNDFLMDTYWYIVEQVSEELELPELRTEIDGIYAAYKEENGREPLYAEIRLEDKGYNNLPRPVTVKLTEDVDEQEDEHIYMSFSGFEELRQWLFSLEGDKNSEDAWCYDSTEQQIVFTDKLCPDEI